MTLVVIHGNYDVEPAAECLGKDAVRRRRRLFRNTDTLGQRQIDGGLNFIDFLVSEHTIFAAVRVESRDGNLRCFYAEGLAGVICDADAVEHARRFDAVACLTQRNMRGNMHHAQRVVREFQNTPMRDDALELIAKSYDALKMSDLAADTRRVIEMNKGGVRAQPTR